MDKKQIALYIIFASFVVFFVIPVAFLDFTYKIPVLRELKIAFNKELDNFKGNLTIIKELHSIGKKNKILKERLLKAKIKLMMNEAIKNENEELSKLLKIKDNYSKYTIIPAKFINYLETNPNRIKIYFDKKYAKYMAENSTVVSGMGLVGIVKKFSKNSAEVMLVTSKQFSVPAVLKSREECTAILKGNGNSLSILFLDKMCNKPSSIGKKMLSANLSENYSIPYIPIALIGTLRDDPGNFLFLKGEGIPLFKKGSLNHLFIIVGTTIKNEKLPF